MHNIYAALSSTNLEDNGIKNHNVFYDTSFIDLKLIDTDTDQYIEYLIIQKLNFNYEENEMDTKHQTIVVDFGDTGHKEAYYSSGNCFVKNLVLEGKKEVLVCGLDEGKPVIYNYNLNKHSIIQVFSPNSGDLSALDVGVITYTQKPIASYNYANNTVNFVYTTTLSGANYLTNIEIQNADVPYVNAVTQLSGTNFPELIDLRYVDGRPLFLAKDANKFIPFYP